MSLVDKLKMVPNLVLSARCVSSGIWIQSSIDPKRSDSGLGPPEGRRWRQSSRGNGDGEETKLEASRGATVSS